MSIESDFLNKCDLLYTLHIITYRRDRHLDVCEQLRNCYELLKMDIVKLDHFIASKLVNTLLHRDGSFYYFDYSHATILIRPTVIVFY